MDTGWPASGQLITDALPDVGLPAGVQGPDPGQIGLGGGDVGGWGGRYTRGLPVARNG